METPSATLTPKTGPSALAQPSCDRVAFLLTQSEAEKIGFGDRWRNAIRKRRARQDRRAVSAQRFRATVATLLQYAEAGKISQRKLAAKAGLSWGAWRRCRDGRVDAAAWLPKVEAALKKLTPS